MATDIQAIVSNVRAFFDTKDKSIIHVGAGGGQFVDYAHDARSVLAVDPDPLAISRLEAAIRGAGLADRFRVLQAEFSTITNAADVVFFEFCLHEMEDPAEALRQARSLAPEILVLDHVPDSPWAWYACEETKTRRSWTAACRLGLLRTVSFKATQHFETYAQLTAKFEALGRPALDRIAVFAGQEDIRIEMRYAMALLRGGTAETTQVPEAL